VVRANSLMLAVAVAAVLGVAAWTAADETAAHPAGALTGRPPVVAHLVAAGRDPSGGAGGPGALTLSDPSSPSPSPSPSDTTPPVTVAHGADARWHRQAVSIALVATDAGSGVASTWYQIDAGPLSQGTRVVVPAPANHKGDGSHLVTFYSIDNAGNQETPEQVTVKIDTRPPTLRWTGVASGRVDAKMASSLAGDIPTNASPSRRSMYLKPACRDRR